MATKSILKDLRIGDRRQARAFMEALYEARHCRYRDHPVSDCRTLTGTQIRDFFDGGRNEHKT